MFSEGGGESGKVFAEELVRGMCAETIRLGASRSPLAKRKLGEERKNLVPRSKGSKKRHKRSISGCDSECTQSCREDRKQGAGGG